MSKPCTVHVQKSISKLFSCSELFITLHDLQPFEGLGFMNRVYVHDIITSIQRVQSQDICVSMLSLM